MRAIVYRESGPSSVMSEEPLDRTEPGPGEVLGQLARAGVNPTDWKLRKGLMGGELPQTTGREVAGVVDEVGEGVTDVAVGDRVFGFSADICHARFLVFEDVISFSVLLDHGPFIGGSALRRCCC